MASIHWKGGTSTWNDKTKWTSTTPPGGADIVFIDVQGSGTLTVGAPAAASQIFIDPPTNTTLDVASDLSMTGAIDVLAGTLVLASGGRIIGGTVEGAGGTVVASGGTADGVVWLAPFGDGLVITPATAAATATFQLAPIEVVGALTLTGGTYDAQFDVASYGMAAAPSLDVVAGAQATLSGVNLLTSANPGALPGQLPGALGVVLGGAGRLDNTGTLEVGLPGGTYGALTVSGAMRNDGLISLDPLVVSHYQQTFHVSGQGKTQPYDLTLTWNYVLPDEVSIVGPTFNNTQLIKGAGATVTVGGGSAVTAFTNSGTIVLSDTSTPLPDLSARVPVLLARDLPGRFEVKSGVAFSNTGLISATNIVFDADVSLASLGRLQGSVTFAGTLDLGNGTLDATATPLDVFTSIGVIKNGTLVGDAGHLKLAGATLQNVLVVAAQSDILHDVATGAAHLDSNTLELRYSTAATIAAPLAITATGTADFIVATAPGTLTFGAATTITDVTAGSSLTLGGPGVIDFEGHATLTGTSLVTDTLTGSGTLSLAGGASLTIGGLDANSKLTIDFAGGGNTLFLPSVAKDTTLALVLGGLSPGDLIDFSILSSIPSTTFAQGGAAVLDGRLLVSAASGEQANVGVAGNTNALTFTVEPDVSGGSLLSVACFRHGTRVATPHGQRAVEALRIGDLVETAAGPRPSAGSDTAPT